MLVTRNSNTVLGNLKEALRLLDEAYSIKEVLCVKHHWTAIIWIYRGNVYLEKKLFIRSHVL